MNFDPFLFGRTGVYLYFEPYGAFSALSLMETLRIQPRVVEIVRPSDETRPPFDDDGTQIVFHAIDLAIPER